MLGFASVFFACRKDTSVITEPQGYDYFPVNIGHTTVYDFDSVFIDTKVAANDTVHYQIKEYVHSVFIDNSKRHSVRIERYIRYKQTDPWVIKNVYYALLTATTAERVEENQRYVKLIFPVRQDATWKGNAYTTQDDWDYTYTAVNTSLAVSGKTYDSTATVTQVDELNLIERLYSAETYAPHIGLISKEYIDEDRLPDGTIVKHVSCTYHIKSYTP